MLCSGLLLESRPTVLKTLVEQLNTQEQPLIIHLPLLYLEAYWTHLEQQTLICLTSSSLNVRYQNMTVQFLQLVEFPHLNTSYNPDWAQSIPDGSLRPFLSRSSLAADRALTWLAQTTQHDLRWDSTNISCWWLSASDGRHGSFSQRLSL